MKLRLLHAFNLFYLLSRSENNTTDMIIRTATTFQFSLTKRLSEFRIMSGLVFLTLLLTLEQGSCCTHIPVRVAYPKFGHSAQTSDIYLSIGMYII